MSGFNVLGQLARRTRERAAKDLSIPQGQDLTGGRCPECIDGVPMLAVLHRNSRKRAGARPRGFVSRSGIR